MITGLKPRRERELPTADYEFSLTHCKA